MVTELESLGRIIAGGLGPRPTMRHTQRHTPKDFLRAMRATP